MKLGNKTKEPTKKIVRAVEKKEVLPKVVKKKPLQDPEDFPTIPPVGSRELAVIPAKPIKNKSGPKKKPKELSTFPGDPPKDPRLEGEDDPINDETDSTGVKILPGVDKRTLRRINTMFGQRSDKIIQLLEMTDTDGAASLTTRTLIQTLVDILPVAERGVRRSKGTRGVMGLNQIISQIRELLHDIQSYKDRDQLGENLVNKFLRPAFLDIAMQMSNLMVELDNAARGKMSEKDYDRYHATSDSLKKSLADFMRSKYEELAKSIRSSM